MDYEQASQVLGCSPRMVRKLVETRQLESVKVGRLVRLEPVAITRYIDAHRRAPVVDAKNAPASPSGAGLRRDRSGAAS